MYIKGGMIKPKEGCSLVVEHLAHGSENASVCEYANSKTIWW